MGTYCTNPAATSSLSLAPIKMYLMGYSSRGRHSAVRGNKCYLYRSPTTTSCPSLSQTLLFCHLTSLSRTHYYSKGAVHSRGRIRKNIRFEIRKFSVFRIFLHSKIVSNSNRIFLDVCRAYVESRTFLLAWLGLSTYTYTITVRIKYSIRFKYSIQKQT